MKKLIALVLVSASSFSLAWGQNCSKFYPMTEGTSYEYTNYNKKGKVDGVTSYTVANVTSEGDATKATMELRFTDKKGKEVFNSDYNITCLDNVVRVDYKSLFPSQMMQQYSDMGMEMDISGTDIELPNDLSVGQELADANVAVAMSMTGMTMNINVAMTDRKVETRESVTTPAGTFDCYLITETNTSETMGAKQQMNTKLWLAEGVGMVKQETYKKNGDLMSRTELTKFDQ
ncbi:hypothetical protein FK220_019030 [Flavobacteriaceae bacterium TP-CH-4]|uniref:DUF3108 domain-containing protein n=1 Tax=Pelagihabitans pacificus TaxID=2696054 RepID=A0A967E899_9FLAO|nr:hypothetical protein [Pelagihabitans pacificus]NHF61455.1 hypothetical protein [Pelagihabitans pacificus]